jgi:hypothetical protein
MLSGARLKGNEQDILQEVQYHQQAVLQLQNLCILTLNPQDVPSCPT